MLIIHLQEIREYFKLSKDPWLPDYKLMYGDQGEEMFNERRKALDKLSESERYPFSEFLAYVRETGKRLKSHRPLHITHKGRVIKTIK